MPGLRPGLRGPLFQEKLALSLEKGASLCWRPSGANICFFYNVVAACTGAPRRLAGGTPASWGWDPAPGAAQRAANAAERLCRPPAASICCSPPERVPAAWRRRAAPFCCQQGQSFSISACLKLLLPEA